MLKASSSYDLKIKEYLGSPMKQNMWSQTGKHIKKRIYYVIFALFAHTNQVIERILWFCYILTHCLAE